MVIYGVALLSACMFFGVLVGTVLGQAIGIDSDVGGVGFAMLFLMIASEYAEKKGWMTSAADSGIKFWSAMYIPIVVAMTMNQNVVGALSGGWCATAAGVFAVLVMFLFVRPITKLASKSDTWAEGNAK